MLLAPNLPDLRDAVVLVLGGSGFVGRHVVQKLVEAGARVRLAARRPQAGQVGRVLGGVGQIGYAACDITRPETLAPALGGVSAVVNLVGAFGGDLDAVQGSGAGRLAAMAAKAGVGAFVHVSSINAQAGSAVGYASSKAAGEVAVREAFPGATILRPSVIFGADDTFINMFAGLMAMPVLPVFVAGGRLQPVYVGDVAGAVAVALGEPAKHGGRVYELVGPQVVTMLELNRMIAAACQRRPWLVPLPDAVSRVIAALPLAPITADQLTLLHEGSVASGTLPGLADMGLAAHGLDMFLPGWMARYAPKGRACAKPR